MKLSIVIPAYNVEQYLSKCLESCLSQDLPFSDYEVVVVNDGSTDSTQIIAESYAEKFDNVKVISQDNQGQGGARNVGLEKANGEYIWFVDSDDWIKEKCLANVIKILYENNLEAMRLMFSKYENESIVEVNRPWLNGVLTGLQCFKDLHSFNCVPWLTIYKRSFLTDHKLHFISGIYHEDTEFSPRAYYYLKRISFYNHPIYIYRVSQSSVMHTHSLRRSKNLITAAMGLYNFSDSIALQDRSTFYRYASSGALNPSFANALRLSHEEQMAFIDYMNGYIDLYKVFMRSPLLVHKIEGLLWRLFPKHCLGIYKLLHLFN